MLALHAAASLAEENILAATFEIAKAYDDLQLAHKKEVYCTIVTAEVSAWPHAHIERGLSGRGRPQSVLFFCTFPHIPPSQLPA
jgi:hypothetical protein